jgi:26S proteasome regulatory subunit N12
MHLNEVTKLYETLNKEFNSANPNLQKCGEYLEKLKIAMIEFQFIAPEGEAQDQKILLLTREVLEIGALWSIRVKDISSFERYIAQLKTYYHDYSDLPQSQRMYSIIGLNLLRLLAQNRLSEFHTELETIEPDQLVSNIYIKHPVEIEQCLMEGSYNRVWNARANVPANEYLFFMDILVDTIRNDIASCSEKAYTSLPLSDAATLLYFNNEKEVLEFAKERNWNVNMADKKIYFVNNDKKTDAIPTNETISKILNYARELERIV